MTENLNASLKSIERMRILHCSASDVKCLATQWNLKLTSIQAVRVNITFYLVRNVTVEYSTRTFFRRKLSFRFQRLNDLFDRYVARQIFKWTLWCVFYITYFLLRRQFPLHTRNLHRDAVTEKKRITENRSVHLQRFKILWPHFDIFTLGATKGNGNALVTP